VLQRVWAMIAADAAPRPYAHVVGFGARLAGYAAVTFAAWLGCPSLVLVRGNDFDEDWFDPARGWYVRESLARASVVGAVAPGMVRRINALFPAQDVRFVPNGVEVSRWELLPADIRTRDETRRELSRIGGNEPRRVVGLFGELKYKKGVAQWLGALRDAGLVDRISLLLVGDRVDGETLEILEDPLLSPPSLRLPFVEQDRLAGLYAACDFVAFPSLYDGMPNALLEAMAVGAVPLVSDAGAMAEIVQDGVTGFVFPAHDRQMAAEITARAVAIEREHLNGMAAAARDFVARNFSIERELDVLCEILR
jgi:glycogen synthase